MLRKKKSRGLRGTHANGGAHMVNWCNDSHRHRLRRKQAFLPEK